MTVLLFVKGGTGLGGGAAGDAKVHAVKPAHDGFTPPPIWDQVAFANSRASADALRRTAADGGAQSFLEFDATPHVVIDGPAEGVHLITLIRRKAGLTNAEFCDHYINRHAKLVLQNRDFLASTSRYSQYHVRPESIVSSGDIVPYDGISEFWFHSIEQATATWAAPDYAAVLRPDELTFMLNPPNHRLMLAHAALVRG